MSLDSREFQWPTLESHLLSIHEHGDGYHKGSDYNGALDTQTNFGALYLRPGDLEVANDETSADCLFLFVSSPCSRSTNVSVCNLPLDIFNHAATSPLALG